MSRLARIQIKPTRQQVADLKALLRKRGMTCERVAELALIGRAQFSQMLNGRRDGARSWPRILAVLDQAEVAILTQDLSGGVEADAPALREGADPQRETRAVDARGARSQTTLEQRVATNDQQAAPSNSRSGDRPAEMAMGNREGEA